MVDIDNRKPITNGLFLISTLIFPLKNWLPESFIFLLIIVIVEVFKCSVWNT